MSESFYFTFSNLVSGKNFARISGNRVIARGVDPITNKGEALIRGVGWEATNGAKNCNLSPSKFTRTPRGINEN